MMFNNVHITFLQDSSVFLISSLICRIPEKSIDTQTDMTWPNWSDRSRVECPRVVYCGKAVRLRIAAWLPSHAAKKA